MDFGPAVSWLRGVRRCLSRSWVSWSPPPVPHSFELRPCVFFCCPPLLHWGVCRRVRGDCSSGGLLLSAGCRRVRQGGPPVFFLGGPSLAGGFARLFWSGCVASRLCVCLLPPPFFSSVLFACFLFFLFRKVCLFLPLPSLGGCTHWSAFGVADRVAVGACAPLGLPPAQGVGWDMYTLGLVAFPVRLGSRPAGWASGSAGWAVAPGGFVRSWVKGGGVFRVPPPLWCRL